MKLEMFENYGPPALKLLNLKIWIHSRQYPDSNDYWDVNWLNVTALCSSPNAKVWSTGAFIHASELSGWREQLVKMKSSLKGVACLNCMEPNLNVKMEINKVGQIYTVVTITGDNINEAHEFNFEVDQTFLPELIQGLDDVLAIYPIKGRDDRVADLS